jgi:hypothetical protein
MENHFQELQVLETETVGVLRRNIAVCITFERRYITKTFERRDIKQGPTPG